MKHILTLAALLCSLAANAAETSPVEVRVNLANPNIPAGKKHTNYIKIGLKGREAPEKLTRPPVNVAVVLDRSGSMGGEKIENAKRAAKEALQRLGGDDIVSIIAFADHASVVVPATKVTNRDDVIEGIQRIRAGGSTALFEGVSRAAEELRKFKNPKQVNRIVLLSDGQANIGPSSVEDLARLGVSFAKESISVTTIGLGLDYNERLMARLAQTSDGNHAFVNEPGELASLFTEEFGDILSVVAQDLHLRVQCPENVRPVRVLGRDADIRGGVVEVSMNQLRATQEKYALLEVETQAGEVNADQLIADVSVSYRLNVESKPTTETSRAVAHRVATDADVAKAENREIMIEVAKQIGVERQIIATDLSDQGKIKEAEKVFLDNADNLKNLGKKYASQELMQQGTINFNLNGANTYQGTTWQSAKRRVQVLNNGLTTGNRTSNVMVNEGALSVGVPEKAGSSTSNGAINDNTTIKVAPGTPVIINNNVNSSSSTGSSTNRQPAPPSAPAKPKAP